MKRIQIKKLRENIGTDVVVSGFVQTIRKQSKIAFIILRDVTGLIQCVVLSKELVDIVSKLSVESVVSISGLLKEAKQSPTNGMEIEVKSVEILSHADPELPIPVVVKSGDESEITKRLDWRWIDLRKPENTLIFKIWTDMEHFFRQYWIDNGYLEIHSPKMMSTPSESGAELFEVKYFDRTAYLAQSPQFYKQMAMASGFERVFEVGPVFRANPSFTSRHDTEFTGYDCEISYIESHQDVMNEEQRMLNYVIEKISDKYGSEIKKVFGREIIVPKLPFPQLTLGEAKEILSKLKIKSDDPGDLNPEEERAICDHILKEKNHEFVFITEYPKKSRAFYHMRKEGEPNLTKGFDLIWNGIEITTGAQREHRHEKLLEQVKEKGLNTEPLQNYLNFFKYGCPPHGGFGFSPSRLLMKLLNIGNVREVTYIYRGPKRLDP